MVVFIHIAWLAVAANDVKLRLAFAFKVWVPLALADPVAVAEEVILDGLVAPTVIV